MTRDATAPAATPQPIRAGRRGFALAALAFLKAELGAAQTITTGAGPLASAIEIPVDGRTALGCGCDRPVSRWATRS